MSLRTSRRAPFSPRPPCSMGKTTAPSLARRVSMREESMSASTTSCPTRRNAWATVRPDFREMSRWWLSPPARTTTGCNMEPFNQRHDDDGDTDPPVTARQGTQPRPYADSSQRFADKSTNLRFLSQWPGEPCGPMSHCPVSWTRRRTRGRDPHRPRNRPCGIRRGLVQAQDRGNDFDYQPARRSRRSRAPRASHRQASRLRP